MINTFSYHAQLADLGVSMACNYTNFAMSCGYTAAALAFAVPMALAAAARPSRLPAVERTASATASDTGPYAAYRSDGGHATTHVIIGALPKR